MRTRILILFLFCATTCVVVWTVVRFADIRRLRPSFSAGAVANGSRNSADAWNSAVEKVKEDRGAEAGGPVDGKHFHEATGSEKHLPVPAKARHRKHNLLSGFGSASARCQTCSMRSMWLSQT